MINAIINGIFWLITQLFNLILTPFVAAIVALFPDLATVINSITSFFSYASQYAVTVCRLLLIPQGAIMLLLDFFLIIFSIQLIRKAISLVITIYNKFKP